MKQTKTFIVFRDKKTGAFLVDYQNKKSSLAFKSTWSDDIEDAINITKEKFEEENERYKGMLDVFGAEPIEVKAEYTLTTLDGKEPKEINYDETKATFAKLASIFGGDD